MRGRWIIPSGAPGFHSSPSLRSRALRSSRPPNHLRNALLGEKHFTCGKGILLRAVARLCGTPSTTAKPTGLKPLSLQGEAYGSGRDPFLEVNCCLWQGVWIVCLLQEFQMPIEEQKAYDLFLSCHWRDRDVVEPLARALRQDGQWARGFHNRWYLVPGPEPVLSKDRPGVVGGCSCARFPAKKGYEGQIAFAREGVGGAGLVGSAEGSASFPAEGRSLCGNVHEVCLEVVQSRGDR